MSDNGGKTDDHPMVRLSDNKELTDVSETSDVMEHSSDLDVDPATEASRLNLTHTGRENLIHLDEPTSKITAQNQIADTD